MKKVAFYTLGCKLNYAESSTIARSFESKGFQKVEFHQKADIYIINTCSVTENADKKCKKIVKEALKTSPTAFIAIIGCYAQLKPEEITKIPGVDAVLGAAEKFQLIDLLGSFEKKNMPVIFNQPIAETKDYYCSYSINDRTRTFLKVQDGCDYSCTFCTIPLARGSSRSDTIENVIQAAKEICESEVKEIVLTGVNIGDFGLIEGERKFNFLSLATALEEQIAIPRIRISSIEPNLLNSSIIELVAKSDKFVPHFHIPLQSGSNKVLKLMKRRYLRELYVEKVQQIKSKMPHCCIGVDVIVGFPGETNEDFLDTYQFLNELDISYLHVFTYSERANTPAFLLPEPINIAERNERSHRLRILSEKKRRNFYEQFIGTDAEVLFEADQENGKMFGFTRNYIKVTAKYDPLWVNEVRKVRLVAINADGNVEIKEIEELALLH
ncbi:MAG: tRNA (N(6)-L-threonylcarbamoyladenosine(37)-C(2))-methylthiotransferase MtaB [Cytophagales bacterium]|nr:MAG: tRNA (N(6)-L-threonylcarbamoyladenosine(37)-C(2))-methylthiotransferase MtaB [Cytophagales bacterium]